MLHIWQLPHDSQFVTGSSGINVMSGSYFVVVYGVCCTITEVISLMMRNAIVACRYAFITMYFVLTAITDITAIPATCYTSGKSLMTVSLSLAAVALVALVAV